MKDMETGGGRSILAKWGWGPTALPGSPSPWSPSAVPCHVPHYLSSEGRATPCRAAPKHGASLVLMLSYVWIISEQTWVASRQLALPERGH